MYTVGWFSTARGPTSRALLRAAWEAMQQGDIPAQVAFVFCSREPGESEETDQFLEQVKSYGIPLITCSFARFRREHGGKGVGRSGAAFAPWREAYDQEVLGLLQGYQPDLAVLAGYMLVMTPALCQRFTTINLHPAAPGGPAGTWQEVIWEIIEQGADYSGVRMHLVTPELDEGPIVSYCTYPLRGEGLEQRLWEEAARAGAEKLKALHGEEYPLLRRIRQEGVAREIPLTLATIKAFSEGRVSIKGGQPVDQNGKPVEGYDLTEEIEKVIQQKNGPGA